MNTSRLLVHVQKGWEDGLYISCVASSANLWGIVMDAGTEFVQQIYKVHYSSFLPKVRTLRGIGAAGSRPGAGAVGVEVAGAVRWWGGAWVAGTEHRSRVRFGAVLYWLLRALLQGGGLTAPGRSAVAVLDGARGGAA